MSYIGLFGVLADFVDRLFQVAVVVCWFLPFFILAAADVDG